MNEKRRKKRYDLPEYWIKQIGSIRLLFRWGRSNLNKGERSLHLFKSLSRYIKSWFLPENVSHLESKMRAVLILAFVLLQ
jgi:hypothetical protein